MSDKSASAIVDIGDNHSYKLIEFKNEIVGIELHHLGKDGEKCRAWIPFSKTNYAKLFNNKIETWDLVSLNPLTLSPSLACRVCGDHGFIENGKWRKV